MPRASSLEAAAGLPAAAVCLASDADRDDWNRFLDRAPQPTSLARYEWRHVISTAYGNRTFFYLARRAGEIVGVLPGYVARSLRGHRRFFALRSGAVVSDEAALNDLISMVQADAVREKWRDWTVIHRGHSSVEAASVLKTTLVFRLGDSEDVDWKSLSQKARNKVRKAGKSGITFATGPQYMDAVYAVYRDNMLRLGVSIHSRRFFSALDEALGKDVVWAVALKDATPIAGMCLLASNGGAVHDFQSAAFACRNEGPVQFLNWEAIRWCRQQGIPMLDFGESTKGSSVYRSKTGFGALAEPVTYYRPVPESLSIAKAGSSRRNQIEGLLPDYLRTALAIAKRRRGRIL
jgi:hypothetical protein